MSSTFTHRRRLRTAAAFAVAGALSGLSAVPSTANARISPLHRASAASHVRGENRAQTNAPFQLTAAPGKLQQAVRDNAPAGESILVGYTFKLDKIPSSHVYNRVQARKTGQSFYSAVIRSAKGKASYLQLEKVVGGKTEVLRGGKVEALKAGKDYRIEMEVTGTAKPNLSARIYAAGSQAPQWQLTVVDDLDRPLAPTPEAGATAYVEKSASAPVHVSVDEFSATQPTAQPNAQKPSGYLDGWGEPVFDEEFDDPSLSRWNVHDNDYVRHDWATIVKDNVSVAKGKLTLNTKRLSEPVVYEKDDKKRWYSSGNIDTVGKFSQAYGRFEMRAKLPTVKGNSRGIWPAFWLRPDNESNGGEIDILEAYGTPDTMDDFDPSGRSEGTVHYTQDGENWTKSSKFTPENIDLSDGKFHTWTLEWTPEKITFFIDGQAYHEVKKSDDPRWVSAFGTGDPYHIRLNVQVGSKHWGTPNPKDTADHTDYVVDYVRVWRYGG